MNHATWHNNCKHEAGIPVISVKNVVLIPQELIVCQYEAGVTGRCKIPVTKLCIVFLASIDHEVPLVASDSIVESKDFEVPFLGFVGVVTAALVTTFKRNALLIDA